MATISSLPPLPPLPAPQCNKIAPGLTLLLPLSRRGTGPGLIILVPELSKGNLTIDEGIPFPFIKWAEESYTVVEIETSILKDLDNAEKLLRLAVDIFSRCDQCEPKKKDRITYNSQSWNLVGPILQQITCIQAAVVYASADEASMLSTSTIPTARHLAGKANFKLLRMEHFIDYEYPTISSATFPLPFQSDFNYHAESVAHTRDLTFLKKHMGGPYFDLEAIWDEHTYYEFENRSVEHTMSTMVQEPYVNHVTTMTGGIGHERLTNFYRDHFIWKNPEGTVLELISRTIGIDRVVDEFIFKFRHDSEIDWLIPGIPPTYRNVEVPMTAVVNIRGDRLYHEHIAWDQGTVLMQLGLMPSHLPFPYGSPKDGKKLEYRVPAAGVETAQKMRDKNSMESNEMFSFGLREV